MLRRSSQPRSDAHAVVAVSREAQSFISVAEPLSGAARRQEEALGYESRHYAASFEHEGVAIPLPRSGAWLVRRAVPAAQDAYDLTSCYPLLCCSEWASLRADLDDLPAEELISVTAVVDPLCGASREALQGAFPDQLATYKMHHVVDLAAYRSDSISKHHRRNLAIAQRHCTVERVDPPSEGAATWVGLYSELMRRHDMRGRAVLPDRALRAQLAVPGAVVFRAVSDDITIGMSVWMCSGDRAYYHLGACNVLGYERRASFALFDAALLHFSTRATHALLGSSAGVTASREDDGLMRFKKGWGTYELPAMLGGRIVDHERYAMLSAGTPGDIGYFPRYRAPIEA